MLLKDVLVRRVDHRCLMALPEKGIRISHKILIKGILEAYHENQGFLPMSPHPSRPLPCAGDRAGIAGKNADVKSADVHTQFQCTGRDDTKEVTAEELLFYLPPLPGKKACTVGAYFLFQFRGPVNGPPVD